MNETKKITFIDRLMISALFVGFSVLFFAIDMVGITEGESPLVQKATALVPWFCLLSAVILTTEALYKRFIKNEPK